MGQESNSVIDFRHVVARLFRESSGGLNRRKWKLIR